MPIIAPAPRLGYDDVSLIAQPQNKIKSRSEVLPEFNRVFVSPMSAVVGERMALAALNAGINVCLHRFCTPDEQKELFDKLTDFFGEKAKRLLWVSVGLGDWLRINHVKPVNVVVDVANGYLKQVIEFHSELTSCGYAVMSGNIHSAAGMQPFNFKNSYLRVGIGHGGVCLTSRATGFSRGQITEITECHAYNSIMAKEAPSYWPAEYHAPKIIADGGIKDSGCAMKAFGAGADAIMLGSYFAHAEEAQNVVNGEYKNWGGASDKQKAMNRARNSSDSANGHIEGAEVNLNRNNIKPFKILLQELWDGISSGVSYSGYASLSDFIGNGTFELKQSLGNIYETTAKL